jgi:hypothetical protein
MDRAKTAKCASFAGMSSGPELIRFQKFGVGAALAVCLWIQPQSTLAASCWHPEGNLLLEQFGDVNLSGTVNIADCLCAMLLVTAELANASPPACVATPLPGADLDCDGLRSVDDVQLSIRVALGMALPTQVDSDGNGCPNACESCASAGLSSCLIDQNCEPEESPQTLQTDSSCLTCIPSLSANEWSTAPDTTPCAPTGMHCISGVCVPIPPTAVVNSFAHTGTAQTYTVPAGCSTVRVKLWGAGGGGGDGGNWGNPALIGGGGGGFTDGVLAVSPGESLTVIVGGGGSFGGFGGGGGRSAVRRDTMELATAGGGGGTGWDGVFSPGGSGMGGGAGGGENGAPSTICQNGCYLGGGGGTQIGGGAPGGGFLVGCGGGTGASEGGTALQGGGGQGSHFVASGGFGGGGPSRDVFCQGGGGGGGGGYFGGGGGGASGGGVFGGGGGGGGSGYIGGLSTGVTVNGGDSGDVRNAAGRLDPDYVPGIGMGGATGQSGGHGRVVFCCGTGC